VREGLHGFFRCDFGALSNSRVFYTKRVQINENCHLFIKQ